MDIVCPTLYSWSVFIRTKLFKGRELLCVFYWAGFNVLDYFRLAMLDTNLSDFEFIDQKFYGLMASVTVITKIRINLCSKRYSFKVALIGEFLPQCLDFLPFCNQSKLSIGEESRINSEV